METEEYRTEIERWRASLDENLRKENSWLALAGLIWLEDEITTFGMEPTCAIPLTDPALSNVSGEFIREGGEVVLVVHTPGMVQVDGQDVERVGLRADSTGDPQSIKVGPYTMMLIERGERLGIRLWDNTRAERETFPGRIWFPLDSTFRLQARFLSHDPPIPIQIHNELGEVEEESSPGYIEFEFNGSTHRLSALEGPAGGLFLLFKDRSSRDQTYGSGRFLITEAPEKEYLTVDFNRAYNPPCAFTRYATCPLPPPENFLSFAVLAGEKRPKGPPGSDQT